MGAYKTERNYISPQQSQDGQQGVGAGARRRHPRHFWHYQFAIIYGLHVSITYRSLSYH
jgi:hypothetical protein